MQPVAVLMSGALLVGFALFVWFLLDPLNSWMSGWTKLAKEYRATGNAPEQSFRWQSGLVGCIPYNGCLTIGTDREGVFMAMPRYARLGHPSLFIPWSDIKIIKHGVRCFCSYGFWSFWSCGVFKQFTELSISGPPPRRLLLPTNILPRRIQEACLHAQHAFQAAYPEEEIRSVRLNAVEEDHFVVLVLYAYSPMLQRWYAVERTAMVATETPDPRDLGPKR